VGFRTGLDVLEGREIYCRCSECNPGSPSTQPSHYTDYVKSAAGILVKDKLERNWKEAVMTQ
jgi:hypothetical protein